MCNFFKRQAIKSVEVNSIDKLIGKIKLIDIREPYEYTEGSIKTANNIPMGDLLTEPEKYMIKKSTYYLLCRSGSRSAKTTRSLSKQGYDVINVSGGMMYYNGSNKI
jgi:rhodanese-related sulfurtransferase